MKGFRGLIVLAGFMLGMQMTSLAATRIEDVALTITLGKEPEAGDDIGEVNVTTAGNVPYRVEYATFETESERWTIGERPVIRIEMEADDEYYFGSTSKSHFKFSGASNITFKKASRRDKNTTMTVEVYLKRIGGILPAAEGLEWSSTAIATWDSMEGAKSYEVRLLRNGSTVTTATTAGTSYNFTKNISREGEYSFRVRAVSSYDDRKGEWSDESETFEIEKEDIQGIKTNSSSLSPSRTNKGWISDQNGRWYSNGDGTWLQNGWYNINNAWYFFNSSGYVLTNWQFINGAWYYLNPDGVMLTGWQLIGGKWYYMNGSGVMLTGWQLINNTWYYLDPSGVMLTGWQFINGRWYYMDPTSGAMYANTITPDGRRVDASGARID